MSNQRLRDSINRVGELIDYAIELGHEVIAFTEHETISNAMKIENYRDKIKTTHPDFKVVLGNEIYLCRDGLAAENFVKGQDKYFHFVLLALDDVGHKQIRELSTRAWMRSWMNGKMRRVPTYYQDLIDIIGTNPGHVIGSTACLGGFLGTKILQWDREGRTDDFYRKIQQWCVRMEGIFGHGNFFLEMQPSANNEQLIANKIIYALSTELNIPYIITTDSHYCRKEDAPIHKAFLNAQEGDREVESFYATTYMMDTQELEGYMSNFSEDVFQQAYQNILSIKERVQDYSLKKPLKIPSLEWKVPTIKTIPQFYFEKIPYLSKFYSSTFDGDRRLVELVIEKIESDPSLQREDLYEELNGNLEMTWISSEVNNTHWSAYFLNLQKILDECWNAGTLVGPGRGSGVGFVLLYLLDLIQIDKTREETVLYPWRFLNPDRKSVLDIDTDIEGGRRAEVLAHLRHVYGQDRVANVVTFKTEKSKSAIQTAARGLGIDVDEALYISSLIPADRGQIRTLKQCYYGDAEKDFKPIALFVREMDNNPELWEVARRIEGLICGIGEHAGGVIFVDEPFTESTALMRVPNGDVVTQFELHTCEAASLIKIDLLSVEALDKVHTCLDLLIEQGYIEPEATLKQTYEKVLGVYNIERNDPAMWNMVWNHEIQSLFQMEKQSGIQGIALAKPKNISELAVLNSVIRLMAPDKDSEQPLETWAKYRKNIKLWYKEMQDYGLTPNEMDWLIQHSAITDGICESQEGLMSLVQEPRLGGNSLGFADKCRKGLAKKIGAIFDECEQEFFKNIEEKDCSTTLAHYVWDVLLRVQRGYSFCRAHTLAYSMVALQEMNLAYKYPVIFWNTACLITDSGGAEDPNEEEPTEEVVDIYEPEDFSEYEYIDAPDRKTKVKKKRSNNYDKIATAIGKMQSDGINIMPPNINKSQYTFYPDAENNQIIFGLRGMLNVGEEVIQNTIANRPYTSVKDYVERVKPNKQAMMSLIKGGAFDELEDRKFTMAWYIWETCDKKSNLTLQNMPGLMRYELLPEDTEEQVTARRIYEFNRYLKAITKADSCRYEGYYTLDERALSFLNEMGYDDLITTDNLAWFIKEKVWDKVYQKWMNVFRTWLTSNKSQVLEKLNTKIFAEDWYKYAHGSVSAWEMEALCFYYHEHELSDVNTSKYGIRDFFELPEDPVVDKTFYKGDKEIKMFKLCKICGTCIAKNKQKSTVTLLTTSGVVEVKFRKEYFSLFDKQISQRQADGTKKVIEKSWFNRGNMILVQGIRSGDNFIPKKYASSGGHQLYKINEVLPDGDIVLQTERYQGGEYEEE